MRRVSAISDYLESARKGKIEGGAAQREGREGGAENQGRRGRKTARFGLLEGLQAIRQTLQVIPSQPAYGRLILSSVGLAPFKRIQRLLLRLA